VRRFNRSLIAVLAAMALSAAAFASVASVPAHAQLPPGWTPGTFYRNINLDNNSNPLPPNRPTDLPLPQFQQQPSTPPPVVVTGEYCSDSSGGLVWVTDPSQTGDLTCPAPSSGSSS
jgi:hypothetical protein